MTPRRVLDRVLTLRLAGALFGPLPAACLAVAQSIPRRPAVSLSVSEIVALLEPYRSPWAHWRGRAELGDPSRLLDCLGASDAIVIPPTRRGAFTPELPAQVFPSSLLLGLMRTELGDDPREIAAAIAWYVLEKKGGQPT